MCTAAVSTAAADGICCQKAAWGAAERISAEPPRLSKSDSDFARDGLEFMHGAEVPIGELNELFSKVGPRHGTTLRVMDALHAWEWACTVRSGWPQACAAFETRLSLPLSL